MNIDNTPALHNIAVANRIKNYVEGQHKVLQRKDFVFKNEKFTTAKIVLQSIKSVVDFHSSYICGNPITINGDKPEVKMLNTIYKKGLYNKTDYDIAKNIYTYGNAYEYVYKDKNGIVRSKIIRAEDSFPIYDDSGEYVSFIEKWIDTVDNTEHDIVYLPDEVIEYKGNIEIARYRNTTGLPIHYTSGNMDTSGFFGVSVVSDLMPIMDEIEALLSKMSDSVGALSLNPLGVSIGDKVQSNVDTDVTGAVLNIEAGGDFKWATAELDTPAISKILDNMLSQFYTIAQVPSVLYGQSNISNVSEVSLKLLFNCADNMAKRTAFNMQDGFDKRLYYISKLMGMNFDSIEISFNYNRPIDNSSLINDIQKQIEMGIMSKETAMKISPYINDVEKEFKRIKNVEEETIVLDKS